MHVAEIIAGLVFAERVKGDVVARELLRRKALEVAQVPEREPVERERAGCT